MEIREIIRGKSPSDGHAIIADGNGNGTRANLRQQLCRHFKYEVPRSTRSSMSNLMVIGDHQKCGL